MSEDLEFREMQQADVADALEIIRGWDEEDYQEAKKSYKSRGLAGQYVLTQAGRIVGVTGARPIDGTDRAYRLSWSYLSPRSQDPDMDGVAMIQSMTDFLQQTEARIVFAELSDQEHGPDKSRGYGRGVHLYQDAGFVEEVRHRDYYAPREDLIVLGMRLEEPSHAEPPPPDTSPPRLTDVDEIPDTDDAYFIDWEFVDHGGAQPADLADMVQQVRDWWGRIVFVGVASDATTVLQFFQQGGFREEGRLRDFYEDGVDEIRLRLDLAAR